MLKGKTAVVTGSTSGIGLGIAKALAAQGANLLINGIARDASVDAEISALRATGAKAELFICDLSKPDGVGAMIAAAEAAFGQVDILVNNAGIQHVAPVEEFPPEKWDLIIALNLSAAFHATRLTMAGMKTRKWGRVINIASAHGLVASPFKSAYVAAKHGIVGFTKAVALEVAELGVTCNAICPGYVWTPLVAKQIPDQAKAHNMSEDRVIRDVLLSQQFTKRFVTVEECAALVTFLCSEGAASITGTAIPVDGGWVAH